MTSKPKDEKIIGAAKRLTRQLAGPELGYYSSHDKHFFYTIGNEFSRKKARKLAEEYKGPEIEEDWEGEDISNEMEAIDQTGDGIIKSVTKFFTGREPGEKDLLSLLEKHGTAKIEGIYIYRKPVQSYVTKLLNFVTLGKFEEAVKGVGYDKIFHLSMNIRLSDGYAFGIEKNEKIKITKSFELGEYRKVENIPDITLNEFILNTMKKLGREDFFSYSAFKNNCQAFLSSLLKSNGLLTPELNKFINQDVQSILKKLPKFVQGLADTVTDLAGSASSIISGNGIKDSVKNGIYKTKEDGHKDQFREELDLMKVIKRTVKDLNHFNPRNPKIFKKANERYNGMGYSYDENEFANIASRLFRKNNVAPENWFRSQKPEIPLGTGETSREERMKKLLQKGGSLKEDAESRGLTISELKNRIDDAELIGTAKRLNITPLELHDRRYSVNGKIRKPKESVESLQKFTGKTLGPAFGTIVSDQIVNPNLTKGLNSVTDLATSHYKDLLKPSVAGLKNIGTDFAGKFIDAINPDLPAKVF